MRARLRCCPARARLTDESSRRPSHLLRRYPYAPLRRALAGSSRGLHFQFEDAARKQLEAEGAFMLPLWQRGDTLAEALGVLHAIAKDPGAGRAERHDMIDAFEGLDRHIPPVRAELSGWQQQEAITISRIKLPDPRDDNDLLATPGMRWAFRRWNDDSPLRRSALAGLALMKELAIEFDDVELAGQRLPPTPGRLAGHRSEPRWWINWKWQGYQSIPYCVSRADGWLEVVQPTRTRPLNALVIKPGPKAAALTGRVC